MVAIEPILLDSSGYWKKIDKLMRANKKIGMNIVDNEFPGYLYSDITK